MYNERSFQSFESELHCDDFLKVLTFQKKEELVGQHISTAAASIVSC